MKRAIMAGAIALLTAASPASAQTIFSMHALAQTRLIAPSGEVSWFDGGFGKLRYGLDEGDIAARISDLYLEGSAQFSGALRATATLKYDPEQTNAVDIMEGYFRYRPVSLGHWRWSMKAGAFFPPVSFENTALGWTSPYTLTPSALNTWVGEELRAVGGEGSLEWRSMRHSVTLLASLYAWNDPAGFLLADRGWALEDRVTTFFDRVRLPDAFAGSRHPIPFTQTEFLEMDGKPGWYAGLNWKEQNGPEFRVLRYDNRADPSARKKGQIAWLTKFWSAGVQVPVGRYNVIAQAIHGSTVIEPAPGRRFTTDFESLFALATREFGDVRLAGRVEAFRTRETVSTGAPGRREDGKAATFAASWRANDHVRLTGEALYLTSDRPQRLLAGENPKAIETQLQLSAQLSF
ncbi:MAG TPA: hypothetical protein VNH64_10045 [Parvularculaceae bacterium]|nr:hypothetical protein [Parvularculaceae bacterium]